MINQQAKAPVYVYVWVTNMDNREAGHTSVGFEVNGNYLSLWPATTGSSSINELQ